MAIIPIPTTRISGLLARERLLAQLQGDQLDIFRLQNQVSTGRRITLPSEDAPAAQRAITLQRLLERKTQLKSTVESGLQFLGSTDSALSDVAGQLGDIRGAVLGVAGTTSSQEARDQVVNEINSAIDALMGIANQRYLGRYLFAGSQTNVKPYSFDGQSVHYAGNNKSVDNYSDIGVLFSTNAPGFNVFGGVSGPVLGGVDLDPHLSADTLLSSLRRGHGISPNGALQISDGANTVVVDVSRAVTLGDVARLIEANAPAGRQITVGITGDGLTLQLDSAGGGTLSISEVGSGAAASQLGILNTAGVGTGVLTGGDLEPVILKTTPLSNLLGSKASGRLVSAGDDNDLRIEATANGAQYNGATVQLVDDELLTAALGVAAGGEYAQYDANARAARASLRFSGAGNDLILTAATAGVAENNVRIVIQGATGLGNDATATYDSGAKTLTITVDDAGATTVDEVVDAVNSTGAFTAAHDASVEGAYNGAALISAGDIGNLEGDTGNSGGTAKTLYVYVAAGASTANGVAAAINSQGTFHAELDANDSSSVVSAGTAAVSLNATASLSGGSGTTLDLASGIRVVNGGQTHEFDFSGAETVEDLLNILNHPDYGLSAEINAAGTGIDVRSRLSGSDFQIGENGGQTATQLGLRSLTGETRLDELNYGVGVPTKPGANYTLDRVGLALTTRNGQNFSVDFTGVVTVGDAINAINLATGSSVTAQPATGGGITLLDNTAGQGELRVVPTGLPLAISGGIPVNTTPADFWITARNGQTFNVSLAGATTIQDAISRINAAGGGQVVAGLATTGNGIQLTDHTVGAGALSVTSNELSEAAELLGLVPANSTSATSSTGTLVGADRNFLETDSVFTTLIRLRDALTAGDLTAIGRSVAAIDVDIDRVVFAQAEVGARERALIVSNQSLEDEDVQLRSALSEEIEVDLLEAISNLTARQVSLQASLQAVANILQLSLLNYL